MRLKESMLSTGLQQEKTTQLLPNPKLLQRRNQHMTNDILFPLKELRWMRTVRLIQ